MAVTTLALDRGYMVVNGLQLVACDYTKNAISTTTKTGSGKWYFEVLHGSTYVSTAYYDRFGVTANTTAGYIPDTDVYGVAHVPTNRVRRLPANVDDSFSVYTNGSYIGVGLDLDNKTVKYWLNGVYIGTCATDINSSLIYYAHASVSHGSANVKGTFNFGASAFYTGLPTGYSAWNDSSLPLRLAQVF